MSAPNRNTLWARILVDELAEGLDAVCLAPGSRSTPLVLAFDDHPDVETFSHLDERSAAFFALGRGRATGQPTAVVCTSGTAAANFHPAVLEAHESRVPLLVITADRPPSLADSGANQTTDQDDLYGDAVRYGRTLPEPEADGRKLRSLRVAAGRALDAATGAPAGPVHLNVPFRKPLEPTDVPGDVPDSFETEEPLAASGRDGPFVRTTRGSPTLTDADLDALARAIADAERGLIVTGPADAPVPRRDSLRSFASATGFPVLADPLSGNRFGPHVPGPDAAEAASSTDGSSSNASPTDASSADHYPVICGGYDSYLDSVDVPEPDIVFRFGASPTSKTLRKWLASTDARQVVVDPAGGWREAEFTASDLVVAAPTPLVESLSRSVDDPITTYRDRFARLEAEYWDHLADEAGSTHFEGNVLRGVAERCPAPATLFVSNSMPVRDLDRFGRPRSADLRVLGNRGVSGIDGITSTALGVGSATDRPLVLVTGDLAYYHDMNGLLALERCGVDATIVLVDNDGGGIFHKLPIESYDPPFTELFRTPHGIPFEHTGDLYDLAFAEFDDLPDFLDAFDSSVSKQGTQVLSVETDAAESHRFRERLHRAVCEQLSW